MTYTSEHARWYDTEGIATLHSADRPLSVFRAQKLINNCNHLRDVSTQTRISQVARVGETVATTDVGGNFWSIWRQYMIPWTVLGPRTLAKMVVSVGGYIESGGSHGTAYLQFGLFPIGARPERHNAAAWYGEAAFTNTTSAEIVNTALDVTWPQATLETRERGDTIDRIRVVDVSPNIRLPLRGSDPQTDGAMATSAVDALPMFNFVIFVRGNNLAAEETVHLTSLNVREYGGGSP